MILIVVMCKSPSAPDIDTADSPLTEGGPGQKNPIVGILLYKFKH
jgi:hypothetical protein